MTKKMIEALRLIASAGEEGLRTDNKEAPAGRTLRALRERGYATAREIGVPRWYVTAHGQSRLGSTIARNDARPPRGCPGCPDRCRCEHCQCS